MTSAGEPRAIPASALKQHYPHDPVADRIDALIEAYHARRVAPATMMHKGKVRPALRVLDFDPDGAS